jgi:Uma2 family endonuclease
VTIGRNKDMRSTPYQRRIDWSTRRSADGPPRDMLGRMNAQLPRSMDAADAARGVPRRRFTIDEFLRMDAAGLFDDESVELIDGELYVMQAKNLPHERWKAELVTLLVRALPDQALLMVEPSVRFGGELVEPDILIVARAAIASQHEGILTLRGDQASLLIEIADTSLGYDRGVKSAAYARHAVPEYWLVDVRGPTLTVHRDPRDGEWTEIRRYAADGEAIPVAFPLVRVRLDRLVA